MAPRLAIVGAVADVDCLERSTWVGNGYDDGPLRQGNVLDCHFRNGWVGGQGCEIAQIGCQTARKFLCPKTACNSYSVPGLSLAMGISEMPPKTETGSGSGGSHCPSGMVVRIAPMHNTGGSIVEEGDRHLGPSLGDLTYFDHPPVIPVS